MDFGEVSAAIFTPAKTVYLGFLVLAGLQRICPAPWVYVVVSVLLVVAEVYHNDYLRIVLNGMGEAKKQRYLKAPAK